MKKIDDIDIAKSVEEYKKNHPNKWQKYQDKINNILTHWNDQKPKNTLKRKLKQVFCRHEYEDGSNLPGCQTFICSKCNKEIYYHPWRGFFK